jgi:hypothetical protein
MTRAKYSKYEDKGEIKMNRIESANWFSDYSTGRNRISNAPHHLSHHASLSMQPAVKRNTPEAVAGIYKVVHPY